jgi:hypothetical protein
MSTNPYEVTTHPGRGLDIKSSRAVASLLITPRRIAIAVCLILVAVTLVGVTVYGLVHLEDNHPLTQLWQRMVMTFATTAYAVAGIGIMMLARGVLNGSKKSYVVGFLLLVLSVITYATCFAIFCMTPQSWYIYPKP